MRILMDALFGVVPWHELWCNFVMGRRQLSTDAPARLCTGRCARAPIQAHFSPCSACCAEAP